MVKRKNGPVGHDVKKIVKEILKTGHADRQVTRGLHVDGRSVQLSLEPSMWSGLEEISALEDSSLEEICSAVMTAKPAESTLPSAVRVFVLLYFRRNARRH